MSRIAPENKPPAYPRSSPFSTVLGICGIHGDMRARTHSCPKMQSAGITNPHRGERVPEVRRQVKGQFVPVAAAFQGG